MKALRMMDSKGVYSAEFEAEALIAAAIDLEVAVDDYTFGVYVNVTNPDPEDVPVSTLKAAVVAASDEVVLAMVDADVSLFDSTYAGNVLPREIRSQAAASEVGTLRALRAARAAARRGAAPVLVCQSCGFRTGPDTILRETYTENGCDHWYLTAAEYAAQFPQAVNA